jgi:hypothetical protein
MTQASEKREAVVVAVAKDEAPYLPEWIHHHIWFGFSEIYISLNRTTDASTEILERIASVYPQIIVNNCDWLDWVPSKRLEFNTEIQSLAYAHNLNGILEKGSRSPYVIFLDIDEFWFPVDFRTCVSDWLLTFDPFDILSVHWMCQFGDTEAFLPPFRGDAVTGALRRQVKSFVDYSPTKSIKRVRPHTPAFRNLKEITHIDASGTGFLPTCGQMSGKPPEMPQKGYILHRMMRSKSEFEAILDRGRPRNYGMKKDNRDPFFVQKTPPLSIELDRKTLERYHSSFADFCGATRIDDLMTECRQTLIAKY